MGIDWGENMKNGEYREQGGSSSLDDLTNAIENLSNKIEMFIDLHNNSVPMKLVMIIMGAVIFSFAGGAAFSAFKIWLKIPL